MSLTILRWLTWNQVRRAQASLIICDASFRLVIVVRATVLQTPACNAHQATARDRTSLEELDFLHQPHECGRVVCDPIIAQSVLFHALDYAARLGFKPHPDFIPAFFEPRPSELVETPLYNVPRPLYVPGPDDDVTDILLRPTLKLGSRLRFRRHPKCAPKRSRCG